MPHTPHRPVITAAAPEGAVGGAAVLRQPGRGACGERKLPIPRGQVSDRPAAVGLQDERGVLEAVQERVAGPDRRVPPVQGVGRPASAPQVIKASCHRAHRISSSALLCARHQHNTRVCTHMHMHTHSRTRAHAHARTQHIQPSHNHPHAHPPPSTATTKPRTTEHTQPSVGQPAWPPRLTHGPPPQPHSPVLYNIHNEVAIQLRSIGGQRRTA